MPRPADFDLTRESVDVFLVARAWMEYSQQPLPPPIFDDKEVKEEAKRNRRVRLPKSMALIIFRSYPARCQAYIAENLEEEGWFDEEGWVVPEWSDRVRFGEGEFRIGTEPKYHAQPSWDRAFNLYYEYGRGNDLLYTPEIVAELNREARPYREKYKVQPDMQGDLRADDRATLGKSWLAHQRLIWNRQNLSMTNFEAHYYTSQAERTRDAVIGRKLFHQAERLRRFEGSPELALERYEQAWPFWINVMLQHPRFGQNSLTQEDTYEYQLKHLRLTQSQRSTTLRPVMMGMAQLAIWPHPPFHELLTPSDRVRIIPIRQVRGPLDWIQIADLPERDLDITRLFLATWPRATAGYPAILEPPAAQAQEGVRYAFRNSPLPSGWKYFITEDSVQIIRDRLGLNR
jgi:hypothetical protein